MQVLICYDVADDRLRRQLVKYLERIAVRVQFSVFLGDISLTAIKELNAFADKLLKEDSRGKFYIYKTADQVGTERINPIPESYIII